MKCPYCEKEYVWVSIPCRDLPTATSSELRPACTCETLGIEFRRYRERIAELEAENARLQKRSLIREMETDIDRLEDENAHMRTELKNRAEWDKSILSETCPTDERHCGCVPILRKELSELKTLVQKIKTMMPGKSWSGIAEILRLEV